MFAKLRVFIAAVLAFGLFAGAATAQTAKPSMDDAKNITVKAVALVAARGVDEAAKVFNADGEFKFGEIYVNVIDLAGTWKVYPPRPAGVGQSVVNVKDPDGKMIVQEIIRVAGEAAGEGWVEYRWLNPASNKIEPKVTYVKKVPGQDLIAYVGIYK